MKKVKIKILSMGVLAALLTTSTPVFAITDNGTSNIISTNIQDDTIITEDNICDVLEYLGLDSSNFVKTDVEGESNETVGDLKKSLENMENVPSEFISFPEASTSNNEGISLLVYTGANNEGTKTVYHERKVGGYTLEFSCSGKYKYGKWTDASGTSVSVDSDAPGMVYKIGSKSLTVSSTPSRITMKHNVTVKIYLGAGKVGLVPMGSNTVKGTDYFNASDWIK